MTDTEQIIELLHADAEKDRRIAELERQVAELRRLAGATDEPVTPYRSAVRARKRAMGIFVGK